MRRATDFAQANFTPLLLGAMAIASLAIGMPTAAMLLAFTAGLILPRGT